MTDQLEIDAIVEVPRGIRRPVTLADWLDPASRPWSLQHLRELMPTALIERPGQVRPLPTEPINLAEVRIPGAGTLEQYLEASATQGWIVLRDGAVVFERYLGTLTPATRHSLMSVSKSIVASVAGILVGEGRLRPEDELVALLPELAGTGWEGVRVRHLLDMRAGIDFTEPAAHPHDDPAAKEYERVYGWAPGEPEHRSATSFMRSLGKDTEAGGPFRYQSILTDMLGWVLETVTGERLNVLIETMLWAPIGAEHDSEISVDRYGNAMADGGMSATLRDIARFGELWRGHGVVDGRRVVPEAWIRDTVTPSPDSQSAFAAGGATRPSSPFYRNNWWVVDPTVPFYAARGYLGQSVYIHEASRLVVASFASWDAETPAHVEQAVTAIRAIAAHLS